MRLYLRLHAIFAAALMSLVETAHAADISAFDLGDGISAILVVGEIKSGDARSFRAEAGKHEKAIVLLESDGGLTKEAIEIGEAIRLKSFGTAVINGSSCNSACALIWLAGTPRALSRSGRVGFHATYSEINGRQTESGVGNAIVGRYLTLLNLPEKTVIFATTASPSHLNWLTASNYRNAGIDVELIDDIRWSEASAQETKSSVSRKGPPSSFWKEAGGWSVMVDHTIDDGCFVGTWFDNGTILRLGIDPRNKGQYYVAVGNDAWRSLKLQDEHDLVFQFDDIAPWNVPVTVVEIGGQKSLVSTFSDARFWDEFVRAKALYVSRQGKQVTSVSLSGTRLAFDEMIRCQKKQNAKRSSSDPFAG